MTPRRWRNALNARRLPKHFGSGWHPSGHASHAAPGTRLFRLGLAGSSLRLTLAAGPVLIGLVVLAGWATDSLLLESVWLGLRTMKANTAIALLAGGTATLLLPTIPKAPGRPDWRIRLARLGGVIVLGLGMASLAEYVLGLDLGLDELAFADPQTTSSPFPGRMSRAAAAGLTCAGGAILLLCAAGAVRGQDHPMRRRFARAAHLLAIVPAAIAYLSVAGYAYRVEGLYKFGAFFAVALHTAAGFAMLAPAILLTQAGLGWGAALTAHPSARNVFTRLLPASLLFPFLAGLVVVWGARARIYDPLYAPALFALTSAAASIGMAWIGAMLVRGAEGRLQETSAKLGESELALRVVNESLEERVREAVHAREAALTLLAHGQRMEALGQLAGGIAHDFNNVMQAIQGGAALIHRRTADPRAVDDIARMIEGSVERGISVTRRLLSFARRDELRAQRIDAVDLLAELREVLAHGFDRSIGISVQTPSPGTPLCLEADKGQLETVMINLAANGRDAMPTGGTLTLSAADEVVAEGPHAGHYIRLAVSDTGEGMAPEVLDRACEPFFTTKAPGQGTGLGLAMARSFAEQSGGRLAIASTPGHGTTVTLWLKAHSAEAVQPAPCAAIVISRIAGATALVVDDEDVVREVLATGLADLGYAVLQAADAAAALSMLNAGARVDVMLTDYAMPGMNGLALIRAARAMRPGLPAVLLTGDAVLCAQGESEGISMLRKPAHADTIAACIAALLAPGARAPEMRRA